MDVVTIAARAFFLSMLKHARKLTPVAKWIPLPSVWVDGVPSQLTRAAHVSDLTTR